MFEIIKQKWHAVNSNVARYMQIRRRCKVLNADVRKLRESIFTYHVIPYSASKQEGCIQVFMFDEYKIHAENDFSDQFGFIYCDNFERNVISPCEKKDCPFHKDNNKFFAAVQRYEKVRAMKNNFWCCWKGRGK